MKYPGFFKLNMSLCFFLKVLPTSCAVLPVMCLTHYTARCIRIWISLFAIITLLLLTTHISLETSYSLSQKLRCMLECYKMAAGVLKVSFFS